MELVEENLVGLNTGSVRQVKYVLSNVCGDRDLGEYFERCVLNIERIVNLIMCEINSTKKDLAYWEGLSSASSLEIAYMRSQLYVYRMIFGKTDLDKKVPLSSRFHMTRDRVEKALRRFSTVMTGSAVTGSNTKTESNFEPKPASRAIIHEDVIQEDNTESNQYQTQPRRRNVNSPPRSTYRSSALSLTSMPDPSTEPKMFENVEKQIFVLRFDLQQLSCMLASVKESADHLKRIFNEVAVTTQRTVTSRAKHQPSFLHPKLADQFHCFAKERIQQSLSDLSSTLKTYDLRPVTLQNIHRPLHLEQPFSEVISEAMSNMWSSIESILKTNTLSATALEMLQSVRFMPEQETNSESRGFVQHVAIDHEDEEMNEIIRTFNEIDTLVHSLKDGEYPLQITDAYARRPSRLERLWLRDFVIIAACAAALSKLSGMYKDGTLQRMYVSCVELLAHGVKDHVIEPLTDLSKYLFERIKNDAELIVTRKELMQSKEELKAMLDGYKKLYGLQPPATGQSETGVGSPNPRHSSGAGTPVGNPHAAKVDDLKPPAPTSKTAGPLQVSPKPSGGPSVTGKPSENDTFTRQLSENSMLPVVAQSLKRATDSASASIDSILRAMQETKDALSSTEIKPDLSEFEIPDAAKQSKANINTTTTSAQHDAAASGSTAGAKTEAGAVPIDLVVIDENIDKDMDSLMNRYIQEIESPLKGVLFGSVVTAALIQMQKIKVMTEAAMMRMDQVLASNQLTMAGTAAMPALMLISGAGFVVKRLFSSSPPSHGEKTLRLRLALTNVERSLQAVYSVKGGRGGSSDLDLRLKSSRLSWEEQAASPRRIRERNSSRPDLLQASLDSDTTCTKVAADSAASPEVTNPSPLVNITVDTSAGETGTETLRTIETPSHSAGGRARANTFKYTENSILINRGNLCFDIIILRNELSRAFIPRYQRNLAGMPLGPRWFFLPTYRPRQNFTRLLYRMLFGEVSDFDDELEYQAIVDDVTHLEAPDDEVDGLKKISIATRMRSSYRCFNI
jgi:hypothetical protein